MSDDGAKLASGSADNRILVWNLDDHTRDGEALAGHADTVWRLY